MSKYRNDYWKTSYLCQANFNYARYVLFNYIIIANKKCLMVVRWLNSRRPKQKEATRTKTSLNYNQKTCMDRWVKWSSPIKKHRKGQLLAQLKGKIPKK